MTNVGSGGDGQGYRGFLLSGPNATAQRVYRSLPNMFHPAQVKLIMAVPARGKVLDFGCGNGRTLLKLHIWRPDLEYHGVDLDDYWTKGGPKSIPQGINLVRIGPSFDLPFAPATFDAIYCLQVLEHLPNPTEFFTRIKTYLKPGGSLLVETPSVRSVFMPSLRWLQKLNRTSEDITINFYDDPTHVRPFTRHSLARLAKATGFDVSKVGKLHNFLNLLALPLHIANFFRGRIAGLAYWWCDLYGGNNFLVAMKPQRSTDNSASLPPS